MNANKLLFRPHSIHEIMSGAGKGWSVENSLTCKRRLIRIFREIKTDRYYSRLNRYTEKGIKMEEDAISLYSSYCKKYFKKNEERLTNEYFSGVPDIIQPEFTADTKCCWNLKTLPHKLTDEIDKDYVYQGVPYMDLCNVKTHKVAYCLVNSPGNLIKREQTNAWYQSGCPKEDTKEHEKYLALCVEIEKDMIFDIKQFKKDNPEHELVCQDWHYDIPAVDRIVEYTISMDEVVLEKIKERIKECRSWLNKYCFKSN